MIKLNSATSKYELILNGKVVCKGKKEYCEWKLKQLGGSVAKEEISLPAVKSEFSVSERFDFIEKFVGLIARKVVPSLIITGGPGLGKSHTVVNKLKECNKVEMEVGSLDGDFLVIKGFSTPKALYRTLWENNGKILVLDDADSVFKDPIASNILKGALDSNGKRIISWGAEFSDRDELPNRFEFVGQVIFVSNLSQQKFPQALLSRSLRVDLTLTQEEVIDRIESVFQEVEADEEDKSAVLEFVKKYASKATDLNIRSTLTVLKLRQQFGDDFERISLYNFVA
jgi:hypothetical protein